MKTIYLDTNILIYLSQPHSPFYEKASIILRFASQHKSTRLITSSFGVAEYLSLRSESEPELDVLELLEEGQIMEIPFGHQEALIYAGLRTNSEKKVHPIDATHLACAVTSKADFFVTNDKKLFDVKIKSMSLVPLEIFSEKVRY